MLLIFFFLYLAQRFVAMMVYIAGAITPTLSIHILLVHKKSHISYYDNGSLACIWLLLERDASEQCNDIWLLEQSRCHQRSMCVRSPNFRVADVSRKRNAFGRIVVIINFSNENPQCVPIFMRRDAQTCRQ